MYNVKITFLQTGSYPFKVVTFRIHTLDQAPLDNWKHVWNVRFLMSNSTPCDSASVSAMHVCLWEQEEITRKFLFFWYSLTSSRTQKFGYVFGRLSADGVRILQQPAPPHI
jgi:hypothetical protein